MSKIRLIALFIIFLALSLVFTLPASFALKEVSLDKNLKIGAVHGVWWSFNVDWVSYQQMTLEKVKVKLNLSCLMSASVCVDVLNEQLDVQLKKPLFNNEILIENSTLDVDFDDLAPLMKTLFVKPSGSLAITIDRLQLNQQALIALEADIKWYAVGVQGEAFDLGTIQAKVSHQPQLINIVLSDQSNKLDLSGTIKLKQSGLMGSQIELTTREGFPTQIKSILQGVMHKRGRDTFEYQSKVDLPVIKKSHLEF